MQNQKLTVGDTYVITAKYSKEVITSNFKFAAHVDGWIYGTVHGDGNAYPDSHFCISPTQSPHAKHRDETIAVLAERFCDMPQTTATKSITVEEAHKMFSALIEEDETLVKPLSDEQRTAVGKVIIDNHFAQDQHAAGFIIDTIQRELKLIE